ncbi:Fe-S cluster assembly scaffold protein NifU [Aminiphilus circumscriptus]|jgi:nitrogen fixation NifU-like protein|uniref:Fe-S cluster assembly scaffold protein NifU n=1 Tax=Aminiphilus circumscriptus TaxID=290732 RepID=UPI0004926D24|nr:Fe-S cluster assembly scaffold protein NifU [Aminiphilus circumscriptus]
MYTETVRDYFLNPRNVGSLDHADGIGEVGNAKCGDVMKISIKVEDDRIADVRFETFGCAAAIASSSIATEMIKGKTLDEALKVTNKDVLDALGGLPAEKIHCSLLAEEGIRAAVEDYRSRMAERA